jgi:hypothetical protein
MSKDSYTRLINIEFPKVNIQIEEIQKSLDKIEAADKTIFFEELHYIRQLINCAIKFRSWEHQQIELVSIQNKLNKLKLELDFKL